MFFFARRLAFSPGATSSAFARFRRLSISSKSGRRIGSSFTQSVRSDLTQVGHAEGTGGRLCFEGSTISRSTVIAFCPLYGSDRLYTSYKVMPKLYTSVIVVFRLSPRRSSGAIQKAIEECKGGMLGGNQRQISGAMNHITQEIGTHASRYHQRAASETTRNRQPLLEIDCPPIRFRLSYLCPIQFG